MNPFKIPEMPPYATMEEWSNWHEWARKQYPIRYFFNATMTNWIRRNLTNPFNNTIYWLKSHLIPRRRYHWLYLGQPNRGTYEKYRWGWIDADKQILYAMMNILVNFVEKEMHGRQRMIEYILSCEEHEKNDPNWPCQPVADQYRDLLAIYNWWTGTQNNSRWKQMRQLDNLVMDEGADYKKYLKAELDIEKKENEMLKRLIDLRGIMWT